MPAPVLEVSNRTALRPATVVRCHRSVRSNSVLVRLGSAVTRLTLRAVNGYSLSAGMVNRVGWNWAQTSCGRI
jgi:hypothetical protein